MKVSVYIATSIDGFIARSDGDIEWLNSSTNIIENENYGYKEFMDSVDVLVMGRHSFEKVLTFGDWPYANKRVIVMSHRAVDIPTHLASTVEASSFNPSKLLIDLGKQAVKHVYVDGGKTIQSFLCAGLVDELRITTIPILIGNGIPLFGSLNQDIILEHLSTQAYSNGLVQNRYSVPK